MNRKHLRKWEVRLGAAQVVMLVGVITGSMTCAFYLAYHSGWRRGFENAIGNSLANAVRLPVSEEEFSDEVSDELVSEVYAKLHEVPADDPTPKEATDSEELKFPDLAAIQTTESAPLVEEPENSGLATDRKETGSVAKEEKKLDGQAKPESEALKKEMARLDKQAADNAGIRVLDGTSRKKFPGDEPTRPSQSTLGALLPQAQRVEEPSKKVEHTSVTPKLFEAPTSQDRGPVEQAIAKRTAEVSAVRELKRPVDTVPLQRQPAATSSASLQASAPSRVAAVPQVSVGGTVPSGWFAQIAAPSDKADADALAGKLRSSGFPVVIERANVRGQEYFRVLVGPEESRTHAERLMAQLKREPYLPGVPFIKKVR